MTTNNFINDVTLVSIWSALFRNHELQFVFRSLRIHFVEINNTYRLPVQTQCRTNKLSKEISTEYFFMTESTTSLACHSSVEGAV